MSNWEYKTVTIPAVGIDNFGLRLSAMGSLGWEVCGFASADPTVGFNQYTALLKREAPSLAPPADMAAGWKADPSGRHAQRHWDGVRWTEHVVDDGKPDTDWPNVRAA